MFAATNKSSNFNNFIACKIMHYFLLPVWISKICKFIKSKPQRFMHKIVIANLFRVSNEWQSFERENIPSCFSMTLFGRRKMKKIEWELLFFRGFQWMIFGRHLLYSLNAEIWLAIVRLISKSQNSWISVCVIWLSQILLCS